jgi:hypothetical protein
MCGGCSHAVYAKTEARRRDEWEFIQYHMGGTCWFKKDRK